jgi:SAM-dependent methyltransferase
MCVEAFDNLRFADALVLTGRKTESGQRRALQVLIDAGSIHVNQNRRVRLGPVIKRKVSIRKSDKELLREFFSYYPTLQQAEEWFVQRCAKWYDSNETDYSVYEGGEYFWHLVEGYAWCMGYISVALRWILKQPSLKIRTVLDHGCGLGISTALLKERLPKAKVFGSSWGGEQFEFCKWLEERRPIHFVKENEIEELDHIDALFCFEVFEHFVEPIKELDRLLKLRPKVLVFSAPFDVEAPGHFTHTGYVIDDVHYGSKQTGRAFRSALLNRGWCPPVRLFQGKPQIWMPRPRISELGKV